jgi:hypothetical protein
MDSLFYFITTYDSRFTIHDLRFTFNLKRPHHLINLMIHAVEAELIGEVHDRIS